MRVKIALTALTAVTALTMTACGGGDPLSNNTDASSPSDTVTVGSANFPESELIAEIYAQALEGKGVKVSRKFGIGAREVYLKALQDGSIDLIPEYNGALLAALSKNDIPKDVNTPSEVNAALQKVLPQGTETLPQSPAQDKDTLTVTEKTANKYKLTSIPDLKSHAGGWTLAASPEFQTRYQGVIGLKEVYGVSFKKTIALDSGGPLTLKALTGGDAQVANIFSTDPAISHDHLVVLKDPQNLFLAQNVLPLARSGKLTDTAKQALNAVSADLTTKDLTKYLAEIKFDHKSSESVAKEFLTEHKLN